MKMTDQHYTVLEARVIPLLPQLPEARKSLEANPMIKSVDRALLWAVFHATKIFSVFTYQEFDYLDTHIETAMRRIFAKHAPDQFPKAAQ